MSAMVRGFEPCVLIFDLDAMAMTFFDWDGTAFAPSVAVEVP